MKHNLKSAGSNRILLRAPSYGSASIKPDSPSWIFFAISVDEKPPVVHRRAALSRFGYQLRRSPDALGSRAAVDQGTAHVAGGNTPTCCRHSWSPTRSCIWARDSLVDLWGTKTIARRCSWRSGRSAICCTHLRELRFSSVSSGHYWGSASLAISWPGSKPFPNGFRPKERGFVNGLQNGGASVGAIVAAPLIVWLMMKFDWRMCFVITGFVWFRLAYRLADDLWHPSAGRRKRCPAAEIRTAAFAADLGTVVREILLGSGLVVLLVLAPEVSGGAAAFFDGTDGNAGLAALI